MTEELQKKAEDFIIERYKIAECYREDNAETREYMRMDVHSQYEEEYKLYLDATKELEKENAELKADNVEWEKASDKWKNLYELTNQQLEMSNKVYNDNLDYSHHIEGQLTNAKEIIKNLLILKNDHYGNTKMEWRVKVTEQAEQFLSEVEK